ncbi:MAG TPA: phospholipase D-like domain-containing protein, partial [Longimicrobiaceae bacterium]|nr:phospholipase D-like domain-containing protein [Longimicrobiaceae bacterium]
MGELLHDPWWAILFVAIGVAAVVTIFLTLFSRVGEVPERATLTEVCGVREREFLRGLAGTVNVPLQSGGVARLLNNGDEFFPAILQALREARESIDFMIYIWEPGAMSDRLFDVLVEKAREGVPVRVMVDGLAGRKAPADRVEELRRAGGRWEWFHPLRFGYLMRIHKRNHRRAIIVDGKIGYTGGAAVMDKWLGHAQDPDHWRDCMVEVRGCLATNLQSSFAQLWCHVTGEMLLGDGFFPPTEEAEEAEPGPGESIFRHISVVGAPSGGAQPMRQVFWLSFRAAQERLYITNPYFVPDAMMRRVLKARARAGVDVRVLVPNRHIDVKPIRWASHALFEELLAAGVRIYEYQPTMIHQKIAVIDGVWSLVGSANLDVRSKELNQE